MKKYNQRHVELFVNTDMEVILDDIIPQLYTSELIDELCKRKNFTYRDKQKFNVFVRDILSDDGVNTTLQDELKFNILKETFNKFTLEQLEEKLK